MKKLSGFILIVCLLIGLCSCKVADPSYVEPDYIEDQPIAGPAHSDVDGISIQSDGIYASQGKTEIIVTWTNETPYSVTYGDSYWIQRFENGEWVDCDIGEPLFKTVAYVLASGETQNKSYNLTDLFDVSIPGTYRFQAACSLEKEVGTYTSCSVWVEFTVV